jgi:hypothetical protein
MIAAMRAVGAFDVTLEAVVSAAIAADDAWIREQIMEHSRVDNWPLSQRNALMKALFEVE